jgi:phage-related protein
MAVGFNVGGTLGNVVPDRTMTRTSAPKVLRASFGDGYEQRVANGINSIEEKYSVSFKNRTKEDIDDIVDFFDGKAGVTKFPFTLPDSNNTTNTGEHTVQVVCEQYNTNFEYDNFYTLTTTFRRVYEA